MSTDQALEQVIWLGSDRPCHGQRTERALYTPCTNPASTTIKARCVNCDAVGVVVLCDTCLVMLFTEPALCLSCMKQTIEAVRA